MAKPKSHGKNELLDYFDEQIARLRQREVEIAGEIDRLEKLRAVVAKIVEIKR